MFSSGIHGNKNRSADRAAPKTPATGLTKQHLAYAPLRGGPSTAFVRYKDHSAHGSGFLGSSS